MTATRLAVAPSPDKAPTLVRRGAADRGGAPAGRARRGVVRGGPLPLRPFRRVAGPLLLVAVWQLLCSIGVFNARTLASPVQVLHAGQQLWHTGELQTNLWVSLKRVAIGARIGISVEPWSRCWPGCREWARI